MKRMGKSILLRLYTKELVVVIILMLFAIVEGAAKNCSVSRCSDGGPNIHFPFWLEQSNMTSQPADECASLPGFQLSCAASDAMRGASRLYYKDDTLVEFQYTLNTSIKGLQLSFKYKAVVVFINYESQYIHLADQPFLVDIVPTLVLANSSSTSQYIPFIAYSSPPGYYCYQPFYIYNSLLPDLVASYIGYELIGDLTFFNCSSSSAVIEYNGNSIIDSLSTRYSKVYAFISADNTISMLDNIRSCTKMYDISTKLPPVSPTCRLQVCERCHVLSWSTPAGSQKCEAVRESCKNYDNRSNSPPSYTYTPESQPSPGGSDRTTKRLVAVLLPCIFLVVLGLVFLYNFIRLNKQREEYELKIKMFMENYKALKPTRYSYSDIKKITHKFKHKLGQGGYGSVFKGQISGDILVAVKVLHSDSKANGDDFINEVSTIGKIHHVNVVRLLGYCADGSNQALVYEFQPNHSLEKFVYKRETQHNFIGWKKMQKIALGIAKGIIYLHQGCEQQILHFDIKPNNILLDRNFNPKISDFGLAKLCNKGQSIVSMTVARGTIGYIAPEVFSRNFGNVSSKSDVYSFGMLLLEMVGGKNNDVEGEQNTSEVYFPEWIFHRLEKGGELVIQIENEDVSKIARKLTIVGLWCIGWHPIDRPSMKTVIKMLEADECPAMPPNPFSSTATGNATHAKSFFNGKLKVIPEAE